MSPSFPAKLAGGGEFISMRMTTATTMVGERVDSDEDNDTTKTPTARTTLTSLFDTTTNLWSDAFLAGRGGDFDDDDDGNNDHKDDDNNKGGRGQRRRHQRLGQRRPHLLTQQPTCGRMHQARGVILTTVNKDSDKDTDCEDNVDLIV
jgi:hypothetical protein